MHPKSSPEGRRCFYPRARGGRDRPVSPYTMASWRFLSTRPRGARPDGWGYDAVTYAVSIHAPAGGATARSRMGIITLSRFYPRARGGRDRVGVGDDADAAGVSIHAPAGGATFLVSLFFFCVNMFLSTRPRGARPAGELFNSPHLLVSIHAPAGGATSRRPAGCRRRARFYPRARGGRDHCLCNGVGLEAVSIHAPAGGATLVPVLQTLIFKMFLSTRPRGARHQLELDAYKKALFLSTRPRGARRLVASPEKKPDVSIHAPAGGATWRTIG